MLALASFVTQISSDSISRGSSVSHQGLGQMSQRMLRVKEIEEKLSISFFDQQVGGLFFGLLLVLKESVNQS